ncbi:GAF domain-containing protein [Streptomyces albidoflavus]|uniref:Diguanylate cyclase n=5 Tax=Streptomyces TaxID=1883 RepID=D6AWL0_9ACTN|nr:MULTISPECIES: GAF domain-containing protein [Streptomyces]MYW59870.1 GAF domain-containing protein [Streptomyces sp. SID8370]MYW86123.1 GAF domain-containing protein [Streptomyces sp. SID8371]MYX82866.1 GAF domain-containing protein [Streptomyces sp. SID4915]NUW07526.1 GAF domain-containing protein [Streptomyces sp. CAI-21]NVI31688.1 GAF domain-containing protein [Streptomyces sp. CAI-17]SCE41645.1 GAF domain-containing protein [Streptomyces sp. IgraMP-1]BDH49720.1 hypothetical protein MT
MTQAAIDLGRLAGRDVGRAARLMAEAHAAALSGKPPAVPPRPEIGASWERMLRRGVDPERAVRPRPLTPAELAERRQRSHLTEVLPLLRDGLVSVAESAQHIMVVCDADGVVLWREGHPSVLRHADAIGLAPGTDWREATSGTNGLGTPLVARRPVQVFSAEHFVRAHHRWTCSGAPITDPRDGRLLGVVDVSGLLDTLHPAMLKLVESVAKLAEAELRARHLRGLDRLRSVAAPLLARIGGRAVAVDEEGWVAAVTGMPPVDRLPLPRSLSAGPVRLGPLGLCSAEPLPGGWLLRPAQRPHAGVARLRLDLSEPGRPSLTVAGEVGSWTHDLSPRHAELLFLLAGEEAGCSAGALAEAVFGDAGRRVTVRAELSRMRRYLGELLEHRPYRFREGTGVEVVLPEDRSALLPHSLAPAVARARAGTAPRR